MLRDVGGSNPCGAAVLVVEDDEAVTQVIATCLEDAGYAVTPAATAAQARALLQRGRPDLVLLDLELPDADGLVFCSHLLHRTGLPVIVCSASSTERDRIVCLDLGADDFIAKPFNVDELAARVRSVLRRTSGRGQHPTPSAASPTGHGAAPGPVATPPPATLQAGNLRIDHRRRAVTVGTAGVAVTPIEYRLLCVLVQHAGEVLTREELAAAVYGTDGAGAGQSAETHLRRLRAKLTRCTAAAPAIVAVRGFGYSLRADLPCRGAT
jgi:DNA-binding response OmpR family regulator